MYSVLSLVHHRIFDAGLLFFLAGAVLSCLPFTRHKNLTYLLSAAGALCFALLGIMMASALALPFQSILVRISSLFTFHFAGDALSGFFLFVISLVAFAVSIYSIGYTKHMDNQGLLGFLYPVFIISMSAVVLSGNIITFLIAWETMSLVSYFLVTFDRAERTARAGLVYAMMAHMGTACVLALFFLLYQYTGTMDFSGMRAGVSGMPDGVKTLVFVLSLLGFGTKAGLIPLHTWLPAAHPAAPSPVSALMSGVMIKTGVYGFIRICIDVIGPGPEWWGITILVVGAASAVLGVLYALMDHDIKRLLAYSSVENVGIVLLGIGGSMVFRSHGLHALSALALLAALYHVVNHALFKGLLFLGAGSVIHASHTGNMEGLGGLLKRMPYTGLFFLAGSAAISALPPFNGFVSEWLTYQSLLRGFQSPSLTAKIVSPLGGAALALTGALAAACFVKAFGIIFLGRPRSHDAEHAGETPPAMLAGMAILAALCLVFGLFPGIAAHIMSPAVYSLAGSYGAESGGVFLAVRDSADPAVTLSTAGIAITMLVMGLAAVFIIRASGLKRNIVHGGSWDCGLASLTPRMQYTATAFTKPIRLIFRRIYLPRRELKISYSIKPLFVRSITYRAGITPFFEKYVYSPIIVAIHAFAGYVRVLQSGSLHLYLGYILVTLILLLIFGM